MAYRTINTVVSAISTEVAPGFSIRRAFPLRGFRSMDPFLLIDHMGPRAVAPGQAHGVPAHPHRGFEPVTYLIKGEIHHRDSLGNDVVVQSGDVDWMTAGSGILHSEMPSDAFQRSGGELHGFQIWVNLPRSHKMMPARLQYTPSASLPVQEGQGWWIKLLAGELWAMKSPIETTTPLLMAHVALQPHSSLELPIPKSFNAGLYVAEGQGRAGVENTALHDGQFAHFRNDGDSIFIASDGAVFSVLLLAGEALNEPVFNYGPFVLNSFEEVQQAITDYEQGLMGTLQD